MGASSAVSPGSNWPSNHSTATGFSLNQESPTSPGGVVRPRRRSARRAVFARKYAETALRAQLFRDGRRPVARLDLPDAQGRDESTFGIQGMADSRRWRSRSSYSSARETGQNFSTAETPSRRIAPWADFPRTWRRNESAPGLDRAELEARGLGDRRRRPRVHPGRSRRACRGLPSPRRRRSRAAWGGEARCRASWRRGCAIAAAASPPFMSQLPAPVERIAPDLSRVGIGPPSFPLSFGHDVDVSVQEKRRRPSDGSPHRATRFRRSTRIAVVAECGVGSDRGVDLPEVVFEPQSRRSEARAR